jgi:hypothetical protein
MGSEGMKSGLRDGFATLVEGNLVAAPFVGFRNQFLTLRKQIVAGDFFLGQQTGFGVGVIFEATVAQDVMDVQVGAELAADQDGAVTFERVLFRTQQSQTKTSDAGLHTLQASAKRSRLGNAVVTSDTINVAVALRTTRAKFVAKKDITDICAPQRTIQNLAVEMRKPGTVRTAPHVADGPNSMPRQQF